MPMTQKTEQSGGANPPNGTIGAELEPSRAFAKTLDGRVFARILESLPDLACVCIDGDIRLINQSGYCLLGGVPGRTVLGMSFQSFIAGDYAAIVDDILGMVAEDGKPTSMRLRCLDGETISVRLSVTAIPEAGENAFLVSGQDITQQVAMTEGINRSEQRFRKLVGSAHNLICVCEDNIVTYINDAGVKVLKEKSLNAIKGADISQYIHADYREFIMQNIEDFFGSHELIPARFVDAEGGNKDVELSFTLLDRSAKGINRYMVEASDITAHNRAVDALRLAVETLEDRVEERTRELQEEVSVRRQAEEKMRHMASHDELTGLPNRALLMDRLDVAIRRAHREDALCAIAFIDLDGFKAVNDTMGHEAGDQLLQTVAGLLKKCTRETDTVARIGGDEFVLVLPDLMAPDNAQLVARRVLEKLKNPIELPAGKADIGASIGISLYPANGDDPASLLKAADEVMYTIKKHGKNNFAFAEA